MKYRCIGVLKYNCGNTGCDHFYNHGHSRQCMDAICDYLKKNKNLGNNVVHCVDTKNNNTEEKCINVIFTYGYFKSELKTQVFLKLDSEYSTSRALMPLLEGLNCQFSSINDRNTIPNVAKKPASTIAVDESFQS